MTTDVPQPTVRSADRGAATEGVDVVLERAQLVLEPQRLEAPPHEPQKERRERDERDDEGDDHARILDPALSRRRRDHRRVHAAPETHRDHDERYVEDADDREHGRVAGDLRVVIGRDRGGLHFDYRRPKHPYSDKFMLAAGHCAPTCYALIQVLLHTFTTRPW